MIAPQSLMTLEAHSLYAVVHSPSPIVTTALRLRSVNVLNDAFPCLKCHPRPGPRRAIPLSGRTTA
jgi:hypothetical protein